MDMLPRPQPLKALAYAPGLMNNLLWNFSGHVAPLLGALVAAPLLISGLGLDRFGILMIAWMVIGYFVLLFGLGVAGAGCLGLLTSWLVSDVLNIPSGLLAETVRSFYLLAASVPLVVLTAGLRITLAPKERDLMRGWLFPGGSGA
jgi:hypothetical protein